MRGLLSDRPTPEKCVESYYLYRTPNGAARRTRFNTTVSERLSPIVRVIDATHPLYGQQLEVSASEASRRIGWIGVLLRDGRHRWVPQKATDLEEAACEVRPNRDLPRVSVRTLLPLAEYVRARLCAARARGSMEHRVLQLILPFEPGLPDRPKSLRPKREEERRSTRLSLSP